MLKFFTDLEAGLDALRRHAVLFLLGVAIVALALLGRSWLDAHDAAARLQSTLAAQQKTITDADQRQSTRDAQLTQTLAQIAAAKEKVQTPAQAAAALTQAIPQLISGLPGGQTLPSPITIELPPATGAAISSAGKSTDAAKSSSQKSSAANSSAQNGNAQSGAGDVVAQFGAALASAANSGSAAQNSANGSAPSKSSTQTNSAPAAPTGSITNSDSSVKPGAIIKYPWTALKLELTKLGIGHATLNSANQSAAGASGNRSATTLTPAKTDLENLRGSSATQQGTTAGKNGPGSVPAESAASASGNIATQPASNAKTNSLPTNVANAQGSSSSISTQINFTTQSGTDAQSNSSSTSGSAAPPAIIRVPQADLKPLFDAVEDCEICQAKLAAAQGDLSDETTKFAAATAERDAAIAAARGTFWTRARTAAKWIVIGAAAGAVLARYH
jgi:hypothetical protein